MIAPAVRAPRQASLPGVLVEIDRARVVGTRRRLLAANAAASRALAETHAAIGDDALAAYFERRANRLEHRAAALGRPAK